MAEPLLEIGRDTLSEDLRHEIGEGSVVVEPTDGRPCVFLPYCAAQKMRWRRPRAGYASAIHPGRRIDAEKAINWVERRLRNGVRPGGSDTCYSAFITRQSTLRRLSSSHTSAAAACASKPA